jgi:hypothetical protein
MHEVFLAAGARKLVYPDSGPGPISAVGTDDIAYFGEVSNAEVMTADEFKAQIPELFAASVTNDNIPWLKFRYQGKFLFIKKQAIFHLSSASFSTNWDGLYRAGLIYGVDGTGPSFVPGEKVEQIRTVKKGAYSFKVRTITSDETEMATQSPTTNGQDHARRKSMYTELLYRVVESGTPIPNYPEKKFEKYPWQEVNPNIEITREILVNATYPSGISLMRGAFTTSSPNYITGYALAYDLANIRHWRPVLELIAQNELFKLGTYRISALGFLRGAVSGLTFGAAASGTETSIVRLSDFETSANFKKPVASITYASNSSPYRLADYQVSRNLKTPLGVSSVLVSGDPVRLNSIKPTHKPVIRVSNAKFTFNN